MEYKLEKPVKGTLGTEKYKVILEWQEGEIIADEPIALGGKALGPDPFTLLLSSLAACTLGTLRMYIDRKEWNIPKITIELNIFQKSEEGKSSSTINKDIRFGEPIAEDQKLRLLEIAERCPISRTLKGEIQIQNHRFEDDNSL